MKVSEQLYQKIFMQLFPNSESTGMRNYIEKLFSVKESIDKSYSKLPQADIKKDAAIKLRIVKLKSAYNLKYPIPLQREQPNLDPLFKDKVDYSKGSRNHRMPIIRIDHKTSKTKLPLLSLKNSYSYKKTLPLNSSDMYNFSRIKKPIVRSEGSKLLDWRRLPVRRKLKSELHIVIPSALGNSFENSNSRLLF